MSWVALVVDRLHMFILLLALPPLARLPRGLPRKLRPLAAQTIWLTSPESVVSNPAPYRLTWQLWQDPPPPVGVFGAPPK